MPYPLPQTAFRGTKGRYEGWSTKNENFSISEKLLVLSSSFCSSKDFMFPYTFQPKIIKIGQNLYELELFQGHVCRLCVLLPKITNLNTCFVNMALKKQYMIISNPVNISTKNHAKILTCLGSTVFQIFRSSALLSEILLSDLRTHDFSMSPLEGSGLDSEWPIFVIFGWMVYGNIKSFELQN